MRLFFDLKDLQIEIGEDNYRTKSFENALNKKAMILVTAFVIFDAYRPNLKAFPTVLATF